MGKENNDIMTVRGIPLQLRHEFRIAALQEGLTSKEAIKKLMESFVKASKKRKG